MQSLIDYLKRVSQNNDPWVVVVELVLIGLVVYWVVDFLEGTRGERLFRGVLFILVAGVLILNLVVERLHFDRLQYLYKGFLVAVVIVAVAAFQPEIRRVLIRIGQPRLWSGSAGHVSYALDQIISAARYFSSTQTGAIIVLERQVALGEFIDTGVRLDAMVTTELLRSIFYPGTCLHDMAVIVRGDRIVAARVQLPLAEAEGLRAGEAGDLGSRHRAAVGISAGSDALCVVVSEETGAISIAKDGHLTRNVTETHLREELQKTIAEAKTSLLAHAWGRLRHRQA